MTPTRIRYKLNVSTQYDAQFVTSKVVNNLIERARFTEGGYLFDYDPFLYSAEVPHCQATHIFLQSIFTITLKRRLKKFPWYIAEFRVNEDYTHWYIWFEPKDTLVKLME